jgi:hypothetical protein
VPWAIDLPNPSEHGHPDRAGCLGRSGPARGVAGWFGRFPARTESREDTYLLDPQLRGLSVKVRGAGPWR